MALNFVFKKGSSASCAVDYRELGRFESFVSVVGKTYGIGEDAAVRELGDALGEGGQTRLDDVRPVFQPQHTVDGRQ